MCVCRSGHICVSIAYNATTISSSKHTTRAHAAGDANDCSSASSATSNRACTSSATFTKVMARRGVRRRASCSSMRRRSRGHCWRAVRCFEIRCELHMGTRQTTQQLRFSLCACAQIVWDHPTPNTAATDADAKTADSDDAMSEFEDA